MALRKFVGLTHINEDCFFSVDEQNSIRGRDATRCALREGGPKQCQSRADRNGHQHPVFNQKIHKKPLKSTSAADL
jgi:hypothetical protein